MTERTTPELITALSPGQVFVFGSNYAGRHGKGAAKTALKWGAKYGQGEGLMGRTYGLPTKGHDLRHSLPLERIAEHVARLLEFAQGRPDLQFMVTEIGCGLAGYTPKQVAPLFAATVDMPNVSLPASFWRKLR
mgnify:CR=1 FL=1